jgi:hypothetical protein
MPGQCLENGVRHFMTLFGIKNEGGRLLFPRRERARLDEEVARLISFDHETPAMGLAKLSVGSKEERKTKRQKLEPSLKASAADEVSLGNLMDDSNLGLGGSGIGGVKDSEVGVTDSMKLRKDLVIGLKDSEVEVKDSTKRGSKNEAGLDEARLGLQDPTRPGEVEAIQTAAPALAKRNDYVATLGSTPTSNDSEFEGRVSHVGGLEVVGVKETSKATKADDARVAVREWDARLMEGLRLPLYAKTARAANILRSWSLKLWKREHTRGFFSWLHQRPEYQPVGLHSMEHVVGLAQMSNPQSGEEQEPLQRYQWADQGRAVYCSW